MLRETADLLLLVPGDGFHLSVGQEVRTVPHLHVDNSLFGFVLHKLVGDPLDGLSVSTGQRKATFGKLMMLHFTLCTT